jgi:hypothetical protein
MPQLVVLRKEFVNLPAGKAGLSISETKEKY